MKLYTKRGDNGETTLLGGTRVPKNDLRVVAYGEVDETNAAIGVAVTACGDDELVTTLQQIQAELFMLGAELATPEGRDVPDPRIDDRHLAELERRIDEASDQVAPLRSFVLPGGTKVATALHLARGVCRRAERATVTLAREQTVRPLIVAYLNRLSDLLFALGRLANHQAGVADIPWPPPPR